MSQTKDIADMSPEELRQEIVDRITKEPDYQRIIASFREAERLVIEGDGSAPNMLGILCDFSCNRQPK